MKKRFLVLKPCSAQYLELIDSIIKENNFSILSVYNINDWIKTANQLYKHELQQRDSKFREEFQAQLLIKKFFFGNQALILILEDQILTSNDNSLERLHSVKKQIRNELKTTTDGTCLFLVDTKKLLGNESHVGLEGKICVCDTNGNLVELNGKLSENGKFDTFFLSYVHCPDPDEESFEREFDILKREVIKSENKMSSNDWEVAKEMKSLVLRRKK